MLKIKFDTGGNPFPVCILSDTRLFDRKIPHSLYSVLYFFFSVFINTSNVFFIQSADFSPSSKTEYFRVSLSSLKVFLSRVRLIDLTGLTTWIN